MKLIAIALLTAGFALPASDPPGFSMWKASELKGFSKTLAPKMDEHKLASQVLTSSGNTTFQIAHREAPGEAEFHATQADIFFVQSGEATLVVGGEVVDGKTTAPNEIRGPSIKNGVEKKLAAGDVVAIPVKTPHQVKVAPGKEFTYFVVKVNP
jgi:mannose-6-phosphate isomerase-like protein (cupin superfamily)